MSTLHHSLGENPGEFNLPVPYFHFFTFISSAGPNHLLTWAWQDKWDDILNQCGRYEDESDGGNDQSDICWIFPVLTNFLKQKQGPILNTPHHRTQIMKEAFHINAQRRTPLHLCTFQPKCPLTVVRALVDLNPHAAVFLDRQSFSPLHYAAHFGVRRQKIDLVQIWTNDAEANDFGNAMKVESERDEIVEFLCKSVVNTERQIILGNYTPFDDHPSTPPPCCIFCFNEDGRIRVNAAALYDLKFYKASEKSPLFLACHRNAPLRTIIALLDARYNAYNTPIPLQEDEHNHFDLLSPSNTTNAFPGAWIASQSGAEPWFFSCIEPRGVACSKKGQPDYWKFGPSTRNPLESLIKLLESEKILQHELMGHNNCNGGDPTIGSFPTRKNLIQKLMQHAFVNFHSDVYLHFASMQKAVALAEQGLQLLHREMYIATLSEILPSMEIAQKIGYIMQASTCVPPCICNLRRCCFGQHGHILLPTAIGKFCHIGENETTSVQRNNTSNVILQTDRLMDALLFQSNNPSRFSPLHSAASLIRYNHCLLEVLLAIFPNHASMRDEMGLTPLHHALIVYKMSFIFVSNAEDIYKVTTTFWQDQCTRKVAMILSHAPESAKVRCRNGMTTTHLAIHCGLTLFQGLRTIIVNEGGADSLSVYDKDTGLSAFMLAASYDMPLDDIYLLLRNYPVIRD